MGNDQQVSFKILRDGDVTEIIFEILQDDLVGCRAFLNIDTKLNISGKWLDKTKPHLVEVIESLEKVNKIVIPTSDLATYQYGGLAISTKVQFTLEVFHTNSSRKEKIVVEPFNLVQATQKQLLNAKSILEPKDEYSVQVNLDTILSKHRSTAVFYMILGVIFIAAILWVGVHDQFSIKDSYWLFPSTDWGRKAGLFNPPIMKSIAVNFFVFFFFWWIISIELKSYILDLKVNWPECIRDVDTIDLEELLDGKISCDVQNVTLRIVAGNYEKSNYYDVLGKSSNSTNQAIAGVILFSKKLDCIKKGSRLIDYLKGETLNLQEAFDQLLPPLVFDNDNGVFFHWELQVIHHDLLDHEVIGATKAVCFGGFLNRSKFDL